MYTAFIRDVTPPGLAAGGATLTVLQAGHRFGRPGTEDSRRPPHPGHGYTALGIDLLPEGIHQFRHTSGQRPGSTRLMMQF